MKIGALWQPSTDERELVAHYFPDACWLVDGVQEIDVALTFFPRKELAKLGLAWQQLGDVKLIQSCTAGLNHMGWNELPDVAVAATPGATAPFIAEYVLATTLAWARGLLEHTNRIKAGDFRQGADVIALRDLRIGFVGTGGIATASAQLLSSLGATVEGVSRSGRGGDVFSRTGGLDELASMAARVDVLVVAVPLQKDTEGLIGLDVLAGMAGRRSLLVNVARGPVVKEDELFAWLDSSGRHWAALDVWWQYPKGGHPFSYPFDRLPNVIMTPHNSPNVGGFRLAMLEQACQQITHFVATGEVMHQHKPEWYLTANEGDGR